MLATSTHVVDGEERFRWWEVVVVVWWCSGGSGVRRRMELTADIVFVQARVMYRMIFRIG